MKKIDKILSFVLLFLLIIGIGLIVYATWFTPETKAKSANLNVSKNDIIDETELNDTEEKALIIDIREQKEEKTHKKEAVAKEETTSRIKYPEGWVNNFNSQIDKLKTEYPSGYYWNHTNGTTDVGVTTNPCNHKANEYYCNIYQGKSTQALGLSYGTQCAGFASMLSDRIFGKDAPAKVFYNYDDIRLGDQARINNNSHTVFIIEKTDDYVIVAECNADYKTCIINWGRKIYRKNLNGFYITRWQ